MKEKRIDERKNIMRMTKIILEEREQLEQVIARAKERMATAPEGFLRIAKKEKDIEYYYKEADCNRSYEKVASILGAILYKTNLYMI